MKKIVSLLTIFTMVLLSVIPALAATNKPTDFIYATMSNGNLKITGYKGSETTVNIPKTYNNKRVTAISSLKIFGKAKVTSVNIHKNIKLISNTEVSALDTLKTITVEKGSKRYSSKGGVLYNKNKTKLLCCPVNKTAITIPTTVKTIADGAFKNCKGITTVAIPETVKSIGNYAFYNTALEEISVPKNIITIGKYALGAYDLNGTPKYNKDFVVKSSKGSVAYEYAKSNKLKFSEQILIQAIAHRGDMKNSIPDTLKALDEAYKNGYTYSEFDIWETKSKEWFVFHDSNLNAQCGVNKSILDVNSANYKKYPLKVNGMTSYMPTVEQLVAKASKYNINLYLHMKNTYFTDYGLTKLYNILKKYDMLDKTRVFGSHQNLLSTFKKKGFRTGFLIITPKSEKDIKNAVDVAVKNKCECLITNYASFGLTDTVVKYSHLKDIDIGSYNVNTTKTAKQMINVNADLFISNYALSL